LKREAENENVRMKIIKKNENEEENAKA